MRNSLKISFYVLSSVFFLSLKIPFLEVIFNKEIFYFYYFNKTDFTLNIIMFQKDSYIYI